MTVSSHTPPPAPVPNDSEPGSPASLPPNFVPSLPDDNALWGPGDMRPARDGATLPTARIGAAIEGTAPTIGHIGRYALKYQLGEGGLGTVYAAQDPLLSRLIAVKTLNVEIEESEREAFNAMFLNEARAAGGLSHTHIVTVFDAGISDNRAYIAMELLKGRDLRQLRLEGWRATPAQAALIVRRVADALAYAHSKGVVHRDVKPANIFMIGRTQPKVLDFGIARIAHQHEVGGAGTPGSDIAAGSPYYMAPEQARQETVDRRADVFSLGVVLYELLTDLKPFRGNTLAEITTAVLKHEPPLANQVDPTVPHALALITARALEKNLDHRYRSARALSRELRHWLDENTISTDGDSPVEAPQRSRLVWVLAAAAMLAAGAAWWALPGARPGSATAPLRAASAAISVSAAGTAGAAGVVIAPLAAASAVPAPPVAQGTAPAGSAVADVDAPASAAAAAASVASASALGIAAAPTVPTAAGATSRELSGATRITATAATAPTGASPAVAATAAAAGPALSRAASAAPREPKESPKERRTREARERDARVTGAAAVAPRATGTLRVAVSPWGEVEVDGKPAGTSPPLTELTLPEGTHQIVIRNADLPAHSVQVNVTAGQATTLKHKF